MNFLDQASTTNYSTRAAAASGCAADHGRFLEYAHALFVNQPPEGGPGLSDAELAAIGRTVGLTDAAFAACLSEASYLDWPAYVTARATAAGVSATPTVLVQGVVVRPDPRAITAAVGRAGNGPDLGVGAGVRSSQGYQLPPIWLVSTSLVIPYGVRYGWILSRSTVSGRTPESSSATSANPARRRMWRTCCFVTSIRLPKSPANPG